MDIQKIIDEVLAKLKVDDSLKAAFLADPIGTLEKKLGISLPKDQIEKVIEGIKAKLGSAAASGVMDKIKGLFGK